MDEKIEQLAKEIQCSQEEETCFYCVRRASCCVGFDIALKVIKAGYRKESDTAREIIKWIKLNGTLGYGGYVIHDSTIEQMCKKYGVDLGE